MIECVTHFGKTKLVPKDKLFFRPSVYGIIINDGHVLLMNTIHTGNYSLPGGGVEIGETLEGALRREVMEETGIELENLDFFRFAEQFFYYDPKDVAMHGLLFFYVCKPKTTKICEDDQVDDEAAEKPRWVRIEGLEETDFHNHGGLILKALHS